MFGVKKWWRVKENKINRYASGMEYTLKTKYEAQALAEILNELEEKKISSAEKLHKISEIVKEWLGVYNE